MKRIFALTMMWAAGLVVSLGAVAESGGRGMQGIAGPRATGSMSQGEVRKVDSAVGKLTLRHGSLDNLDMPPMTQVFRVRDPAWLAPLKVGDNVRFVVERIDGNLTVTALKPDKN
ncbi:MAG TPA: copper-binding protein [Casimicrobiaceae bacterium]